MKTNDILSKFQSNNSKLETALYKKSLSGDVKNLLLTMLYNITSSYNDYSNIKVNVESKNQFINKIIDIIQKCENIEIVKPSSEEGEEYIKEEITSKVDTYLKTIKVFPTEKAMLFALFKMNDSKMFLDEKYNLLRVSLPEMLNEGRDINNIEIIRDFNAWSWNTLPSEISNIDCNLIYQNLQILLGFEFLENWMKLENQKQLLDKLENELNNKYGKENTKELLDLIYRLSIIVCVQRNKNEKERLSDEKSWDEKELNRLEDKAKLVQELTDTKKKKEKEINKIDKMLNDNVLLAKEFEKRNKKLSEYQKIYNLENLAGTLKKERKKALSEIAECNNLLDSKLYVKRKTELEKNLDMLKEINNGRNKEKYKIKIQKIFLKCIEVNIDNIEKQEEKKQLILLLRIIRYYNFIVFDDNRFIKDVENLQKDIDIVENKILTKLYEIKGLNSITKDLETDIKIIKPVLKTRIMDLANVNITLSVDVNDKIDVKIFDGDVQETEYKVDNLNKVNIKSKKKVKLFIK